MGAKGGIDPCTSIFLIGKLCCSELETELRRADSFFCNYLQANSIVKRLERCFHMELEIILLLIC